MSCAAFIAITGALGLAGWAFIAALAFVLSRLDRRRYVRRLHHLRRAASK